MIHRIGKGVRRLILAGPHEGDWVEMDTVVHLIVLLEPVDIVDHILGDRDRRRVTYRHATFVAKVADLAQVGLVAQALLSS